MKGFTRTRVIWVVLVLLLLPGLWLFAGTYFEDSLPPEIWVLGGPAMGRTCVEPGGEEVDRGSIATDGEGISLWYRPSLLRKLLWSVGLWAPGGGASYDPTGRMIRTGDGTWHHYVRVEDD